MIYLFLFIPYFLSPSLSLYTSLLALASLCLLAYLSFTLFLSFSPASVPFPCLLLIWPIELLNFCVFSLDELVFRAISLCGKQREGRREQRRRAGPRRGCTWLNFSVIYMLFSQSGYAAMCCMIYSRLIFVAMLSRFPPHFVTLFIPPAPPSSVRCALPLAYLHSGHFAFVF